MNIVGRIASTLFQKEATNEVITKTIDELAKIDWKKDAAIWNGNIVGEGSKGFKISNSTSNMKRAFEAVKSAIKIDEILA